MRIAMLGKIRLFFGLVALVAAGFGSQSQAKDLKINIPKRSHLTPVQRLNREGVEAIRKHNYAKAEQMFYKAYLFDSDDAFTLNNLGYVSELQGQLDRAQKFYALSAEQASEAVIDLASAKRVQGQPMKAAMAITDEPLQINHANVEAVRLLSQGRAPEADLLLEQTLKTDANNVFTLNNLGVAKEMEGEAQEALKFYDEAASKTSEARAVVTVDRTWRGKPVSEMAQQNAKFLRTRLAQMNDVNEQVDPNNAFTLNNIGYVAELEGDRETAQFFYDHARQAGGANLTVGVATRRSDEGKKLFAVAADNDTKVEAKVTEDRNTLRRQREPVVLRRRDNSIVNESEPETAPADNTQPPQ
jgi:Flp pilus assembly protein TadD